MRRVWERAKSRVRTERETRRWGDKIGKVEEKAVKGKISETPG